MREIGRELQQAREEMNLSLEELSGRTMVAKKYLKALETGDYKLFPGVVYLKGALRKYAKEVGLNPEQAVAWYDATVKAKAAEQKPPEPRVHEVRRKGKRKGGRFLALCFIALLLVCAGFIPRLIGKLSPDKPPVEPGDVANPPQIEEPVDEPEDEPVTVPQEQLAITRDQGYRGVRFLVSGTETLELELYFSGRCWVRLTTDGQMTAEETYTAGRFVTVHGREAIKARLGYPPAVSAKINGQNVELPETSNPYDLEIQWQAQ